MPQTRCALSLPTPISYTPPLRLPARSPTFHSATLPPLPVPCQLAPISSTPTFHSATLPSPTCQLAHMILPTPAFHTAALDIPHLPCPYATFHSPTLPIRHLPLGYPAQPSHL